MLYVTHQWESAINNAIDWVFDFRIGVVKGNGLHDQQKIISIWYNNLNEDSGERYVHTNIAILQ